LSIQRLVDQSKTTKNSGQLRRKKPGPFFWVTAVVEESWMEFIRNLISIKVFLGKPQHPNALHHPRPPGSNGSNFGMSKDGTGVDGIFSESRDDLYRFQVEPMKFRKDYVDKAKAQVDANWQREKAHAAQRGEKISRYHFSEYNCQQYVLEVLISADKMAKDDGVSLTF
ncbi:MAG: hypothetical protein J5960_00720, partial [Desulfovibrio sp.]|nr:hypothetical protein [Desulfovibrio sp.]